jgi:hypothetical protein
VLTDDNGSNRSTVKLSAKYIPVDIKLEPRESINNMGSLRVELLDGKGKLYHCVQVETRVIDMRAASVDRSTCGRSQW